MLFHEGPRSGLRPRTPPTTLPQQGRYRPTPLSARQEWSLPDWESVDEEWALSSDERTRYGDVQDRLIAGELRHRLLGHPDPVQGPMQLEVQLASNGIYQGAPSRDEDPRQKELAPGASRWRLLLQLDSDEAAGMMWGDVGRLYFWITEEDLAARRFDRVWMILQCA